MASRYWVGTTSAWHLASNWSTTSGGAGGAGIPTATDDVFIDGNGNALCWATTPVVCQNFSILAGATELNLFAQGGVIGGAFSMAAGYFAPFGGGGYTMEFQGNWTNTAGTFAVGTGTGVDPTCLFSAGSGAYSHPNLTSSTYQHLTFSGSYLLSGTRLVIAHVSQEFDVSGTITFSGTNAIQLNGDWVGLTGTVTSTGGSPYIYFNVDTTTTMTTDSGTVDILVDFYVNDDFTIPARTWGGNVYVRFEVDAKTFTLGAGRHWFNGLFKTYCTNVAVTTSAKIDCAANDGEFRCGGAWSVDSNSFKQPSQFILDWGNGTHIFQDSLMLGLFGAATNMSMTAGDSTIILRMSSKIKYSYRLSRVVGGFPGTYQELTWNKIYLLRAKDDDGGSCVFVEGFVCHDGRFEVYGDTTSVRFRNYQGIPQRDTEFDKLTLIGLEETLPRFGYPVTTGFGFHARLDINETAKVYGITVCKWKAIPTEVDVWNGQLWSGDSGVTTGFNFYDRDVRRIPGQRNILTARARLTPTPPPETIIEQLIEKANA